MHLRLFLMLWFITWLSAQISYAQTITLTGRVADKTTKESLPFASLRIAEKLMGTVANEHGEFTLLIPEEFKNEIVIVSMLGYRNYESPVWSLLSSSTITIFLNPSPTILNEVTVRDSLSGRDILDLTFKRFNDNYTTKPYLFHSFYRDIKKVGGTYVSVLEAALKIYDNNFEEPRNKFKLHESVELLEVRRSLGYDHKFKTYFKDGNLLEDLLLQNPIRYYHLNTNDKTITLERKPDSYYNNSETFVVVQKTNQYVATLFIDKKTFAIMRIEWREPASDKVISRNQTLHGLSGGAQKVFDFVRIQDKMYLNYATINSKILWHDANTNKLKFETELFQQLLVNEVDINTRERIIPEKRMRSNALSHQQFNYNKAFWNNYNLIKDSPEDQKIIEDLKASGLDETIFDN
jgi:hypothetical protein